LPAQLGPRSWLSGLGAWVEGLGSPSARPGSSVPRLLGSGVGLGMVSVVVGLGDELNFYIYIYFFYRFFYTESSDNLQMKLI
jgi:hypothetical protein